MADRTLIICACLVIIAALLFAGTAWVFMYYGTSGQNSAGGSYQVNDVNRIPLHQGIQSGNNVPSKFRQGNGPMIQERPEGQGEPGRCGCPCCMKQGNCPDQFRPDTMGSKGPGNRWKKEWWKIRERSDILDIWTVLPKLSFLWLIQVWQRLDFPHSGETYQRGCKSLWCQVK